MTVTAPRFLPTTAFGSLRPNHSLRNAHVNVLDCPLDTLSLLVFPKPTSSLLFQCFLPLILEPIFLHIYLVVGQPSCLQTPSLSSTDAVLVPRMLTLTGLTPTGTVFHPCSTQFCNASLDPLWCLNFANRVNYHSSPALSRVPGTALHFVCRRLSLLRCQTNLFKDGKRLGRAAQIAQSDAAIRSTRDRALG